MTEQIKKRPTIAFMLNQMEGTFHESIWHAITDAAEARDVNLVIFSGKSFRATWWYEHHENAVYQYISPEQFDGIISTTGTIAAYIGLEKYNEYLKNYRNIPIVSLLNELPGLPSLLVENKSGIKSVVDHLIEVHHYDKIAFVCGPETNDEAILRLNGYLESLKEHNIAVDERLILPGSFIRISGEKALDTLLDDLKIMPQAVVAANDDMVLGVLDSMKKRGLKVPQDIAITGFDDNDSVKYSVPPITSVYQPIEILVKKSMDVMLDMIAGKPVENTYYFSSIPHIRQSCGCFPVQDNISDHRNKSLEDTQACTEGPECLSADSLIKAMADALYENSTYNQDQTGFLVPLAENLLVLNDTGGPKGQFIPLLNDIISHSVFTREENLNWEKALTVLSDKLKKLPRNDRENSELSSIIPKIPLIWNDIKKRIDGYKKARTSDMETEIFSLSVNLNGMVEIKDLMNITLLRLKPLGIKDCWVSLYDGTSNQQNYMDWSVPEYSCNILTYQEHQNISSSEEGFPFKTKDIIPGGLSSLKERFSLLVRILYSREVNHGFMVCSLTNRLVTVYINTHIQLCTSLQTAKFYKQQVKAKEELSRKTQDLEELNKKLFELNTLKNDFIANITHDFRSPLTIILNYADLGQKKTVCDDPNQKRFKAIMDASVKLKSTIDKLLDIAKMDSQGVKLQVRKLDITKYMNQLIDFYTSATAQSGIKLMKDLPAHEIQDFYTDPEKLEEIVSNIVSNALKFIDPDTGMIRVSVEETDTHVTLTISDNGVGIQPEHLEKIFGRFEQAEGGRNSLYKGTGIGLSFSRQLAGFLHGKITAKSDGKDKGASFIIELPKGKEVFKPEDFAPADEKHQFDLRNKNEISRLLESEIQTKTHGNGIISLIREPNKEKEFDIKKGLILLVDDSREIVDIELEYLESAGYRNFIVVSDGKLAIEAVYTHCPDIIISDYNMPVMRGDQFQDELSKNPDFKKIPFIFLTAITNRQLIIERKRQGGVAVLSKPIDAADLLSTIEVHLKKYMEYKETLQLATMDELTMLMNRRSFTRLLKEKLMGCCAQDLSIIYFDIDHFKKINDSYGHHTGDLVLSSFGNIIRQTLRSTDLVSRYGGEEFVAALPDTNQDQAARISETLRQKIQEQEINNGNQTIKISASFGVATLTHEAESICRELEIENLLELYTPQDKSPVNLALIEEKKKKISDILIRYADEALYLAKSTICQKCGFKSDNPAVFTENCCPECSSNSIKIGRNQVILA